MEPWHPRWWVIDLLFHWPFEATGRYAEDEHMRTLTLLIHETVVNIMLRSGMGMASIVSSEFIFMTTLSICIISDLQCIRGLTKYFVISQELRACAPSKKSAQITDVHYILIVWYVQIMMIRRLCIMQRFHHVWYLERKHWRLLCFEKLPFALRVLFTSLVWFVYLPLCHKKGWDRAHSWYVGGIYRKP